MSPTTVDAALASATRFVCKCGYSTSIAAEAIDHTERVHIHEKVNPGQDVIILAAGSSILRINEEMDRVLQEMSTLDEVRADVQRILQRYSHTDFQDLVESKIRPNPWLFLDSEIENRINGSKLIEAPSTDDRIPASLADPKSEPEACPVQAEKEGESSEATEDETGPWTQHGMTMAAYYAELKKPYPVFPFLEQPGPSWSNDILYGVAGEFVRKASACSEPHPAALYLEFLVSIGNIFGRTAYFSVDATRHYTNEFLALVGQTSAARKGTTQDLVMSLLSSVDANWAKNTAAQGGFGSGQAIIESIKDGFMQTMFNKKTGETKDIYVAGVDDKRLFIHEGELAQVFNLANMKDSQVDVILRHGWDGKALKNRVKGKSVDGISNSASCAEPHLSISAATTIQELRDKMPRNADANGFANRFLYAYMYRTKLCPHGGPPIDWSDETQQLVEIIEFARSVKYMELSGDARAMCTRMYMALETRRPGEVSTIINRGPAHVRRLAMIFALLDKKDRVESCHVKAARDIWNYCEDSAAYIFLGRSTDQQRIFNFVRERKSATLVQIREELFQRNQKAGWIKTQVNDLVRNGFLSITKDQIQPGKRAA